MGGWKAVKREKGDEKEREKDKEKPKEWFVTLRFEGEDEVDIVNSVERRYVLVDRA